ncbi:MAG TPA: hypothetical protein VMZ52_01865 [Bryobacteraceae bacterium]|nr:hypothetical protein [Bryobacteraceae bacterium]
MKKNRALWAGRALLFAVTLESCHKSARPPAASLPPGPRTTTPAAKRTETRKRSVPPAKSESTAPAPSSPRTPSGEALGEMVANSDRDETTRRIDMALDHARRNLAVLARRPLTAEQGRNLERVDVLTRQAREAKDANDLVTAKSLADRAELLSFDLLKSVK